MIRWHSVVDDFGNLQFVTEINWPNKVYFDRVVEPYAWSDKKKKK